MENKKRCCCRNKKADMTVNQASKEYSGIAVNEADGNETDAALVKERTATLNNNPRSEEPYNSEK